MMHSRFVKYFYHCLAGVIFFFPIDGLSDQKVRHDYRTFFKALASKPGLYDESDKVVILNSTNFDNYVMNHPKKAWLVEFYVSWCGQCQRYALLWKEFALNVYNWRDYVHVAAIDCDPDSIDPNNRKLCRSYEVIQYPTLKYFPPKSLPGSLGDPVLKGLTVDELRHSLIKALKGSSSPSNMPVLEATENLTEAIETLPPEVNHVGVLIDGADKRDSFIGEELILDFHRPEYKIRMFHIEGNNSEYVEMFNVQEFPSLYALERGAGDFVRLPVSNITRGDFYNATKLYLEEHGIRVPDLPYYDGPRKPFFANATAFTGDLVYQLDIEQGFRETVLNHLKAPKEFLDEKLDALKRYVRVVARYFPFLEAGKEGVADSIWNHTGPMSGEQYESYLAPFESRLPEFFMNPPSYMNCRSSGASPPCSVWLLFHTLTVQAESNRTRLNDDDPQDVLASIAGFVEHFFACNECSQHFTQMAQSIPQEVDSFDASILWLWRGHNEVNRRLGNDGTGGRMKIQYPSYDQCRLCRVGEEGEFVEEEVLKFLKQQYGTLSNRTLAEETMTEKLSLPNGIIDPQVSNK
ncbi:sulfhydryl oxidase 1 isoform X2 [Bemisia tabaci]|uniref:sulfhydryl oxidase 1 isoform X2 n=1 Tax=Bemisia tabaci TaxID=7038 RepID=UPI003B28AB2C